MKKILFILLLLPFLGFSQLSGSYTIFSTNQDLNFRTLSGAVARINAVGVSGPVTFLLNENQTVTSQITINQFAGSSATNILTIKPNVGKNITVTANKLNQYTGVASVFTFNGSKNIIIDGSNSTAATKNLTLINNDNLGYNSRSIIWISSNGTIPSSNITIKNSILKFTNRNDGSNLSTAIYSGNNGMGGNNSIEVQASTAANSDIYITDNEAINVKEGIYINGNSTTTLSPARWKIQGNQIGSIIDAEKPIRGILVSNALNYEISGNTISGIKNTVNQSNDAAAIILLGTSSGTLSSNKISDIVNTISNNNYYTAGILIRSTGITNINNNFISNVYNAVTYSNNYNYYNLGHGIFVTSGSATNIYYNTIVMSGGPSGSAFSSCLYTTGGSDIKIKNNIFVNSQANTQYALFLNGGIISAISNNDYYVTNATGKFLNRKNDTPYAGTTGITVPPSTWNTDAVDSNSKIFNPSFVSSTDLHLQSVTANVPLKAGIPIATILTDIDGEVRAITPNKPYMGADEICTRPAAAGTISGSASVCSGQTNVAYSVPVIAEATSYVWSYTGSGVTFTNGSTKNPTLAFAANATSGNLTVKGKNDCGEGTVSATYAITVHVLPTQPIIGTVTQPTCAIAIGTITITAPIETGMTYSINGSTYTNTTGIFNNVAEGTYNVTAKNASGCVSLSTSVSIMPPVTATWNVVNGNGSWTNGPPTIAKTLVFNGNYNSLTTTDPTVLEGCSVTVNPGAVVVFTAGKTLKVTNKVMVIGTGTLTFEDSASLVQVNDVENQGNITVKRKTQSVKRYDYTYWSSPVALQELRLMSPLTLSDKYYSFNAASQGWLLHYNGAVTMANGKGYIVRAPQTFDINTPAVYEAPFIGVPNNGVIQAPISGGNGQWNLIGNPYPSAIDADAFLKHSANTSIDGTIYLWTHNSPPNNIIPGDATYNYTSSDYAAYNLSGGIQTAAEATGGVKPSRYIASGQAFFIKGLSNANATFNNSMRVTGSNDQFFRSVSGNALTSATTDSIEKNRIWLNLTNAQGAFGQLLVGYIEGATNGLDRGFDGEVFGGNYVTFYSIAQSQNLTIQGRALPFDANDTVPLGYISTLSGAFQISINNLDGVFSGTQNVYLEDLLLGTIHDLNQSPYDFTTAVGTFNNRFVLRYTNGVLGIPGFESTANQVIVASSNQQVQIRSEMQPLQKVTVYDILGRVVFEKGNINATEFTSEQISVAQQSFIVKIVLDNGQTISRKIIF